MLRKRSQPARRPRRAWRPHRRRPVSVRASVLGAVLTPALLLTLSGCEPSAEPVGESDARFRHAAQVASPLLDEISGLQASHRHPGLLWTHNDDGRPRVHALGTDGADRGYFDIARAVNTDWEDMTRIPGRDGRDLLVLADVGDNKARRSRVWLYFVPEPDPGPDGRFSGEVDYLHWISLAYPDGPQDTESIAWDPVGQRLLLLSKRQQQPVLYALDGERMLTEDEVTLTRLGEIAGLRPPTRADRRVFGERAPWISQPTALDVSPDGNQAALLTYRSLYLYQRRPGQDWSEALNSEPLEILGPPAPNEEAVSYDPDGTTIWIGAEGERSPLYEFKPGDP